MIPVKNLYDYPVKILLAFEMAISGDKNFFQWLLENNFPELAALSNAIRGNTDAINWLVNHGYRHFAAFDAASVDDDNAMKWLENHSYTFLATLAKASRGQQNSIDKLNQLDLEIFVRIARRIKEFSDGQTFDYHKIPF